MNVVPIVVMPYEPREIALVGRDRVAEQSRRAREALSAAAAAVGAQLGPLTKDAEDAPIASNGWHWSLSHATYGVAAALGRSPIGIDIEWIRPRNQALVPRVTSRDEIELFGGFSWVSFFRVWTAKESVLKKAGCGILELSGCTLVAVPDDTTLVLRHRERDHIVRQMLRDEHIVSISHDDAAEVSTDWRWSSLAIPAANEAT
ncbi:MAG: 4'-phosphopantetheinyl transferase superfamily protein [Planctomycetota bacterium]|nr:4'-phosphopantetheinyl transferase superfamily protein [Planctomycetota bacterium]